MEMVESILEQLKNAGDPAWIVFGALVLFIFLIIIIRSILQTVIIMAICALLALGAYYMATGELPNMPNISLGNGMNTGSITDDSSSSGSRGLGEVGFSKNTSTSDAINKARKDRKNSSSDDTEDDSSSAEEALIDALIEEILP